MKLANRSVVAMLAIVSGLVLATGAQAAAQQHRFTLPLVGLNNPCTPGPDSIDGSLDIHGVTKHGSGNVSFLHVNANGAGVDAHGRQYVANANAKFQFHDPLPAQVQLHLRLISQGSTDNAHLTVALHVNEQGNITHAAISGIECRG